MKKKLREASLSPVVSRWLAEQGLTVYAEVPWHETAIDLVGVDPARIVAVELKTSFTCGLIRQAYLHQMFTQESFIAAPTEPSLAVMHRAAKFGLGVLKVSSAAVEVRLDPYCARALSPWHKSAASLRERVSAMEPGGIGGLPTLAGSGPAMECLRRVQIFRKANPRASWREIFERVANHYCNARSMQGAMRIVQRKAERRKRLRRKSLPVTLSPTLPLSPSP